MKELIHLCEVRRRTRHIPYVLATVLRVEGSSYRRPGARMLVDINGRVAGSVSGGCLEKNVISQSLAALLDGRSRLLSFDTTDQDDLALGTSLGCEGKIWIGLEVLPAKQPWILETLVDEIQFRRESVALITRIRKTEEGVDFDSYTSFASHPPQESGAGWGQTLITDVAEVLRTRKTRFVGQETLGSVLIEWLAPPLSLLLFGGGPDAPILVKLAHDLGHEVTVVDRRPDFAAPDCFPGARRVLNAKPHQLATLLRPDDRSVAILMNHHYDTDRDVLAAILNWDLPYIAMLGPKRRTERILADLRMEGHDISGAVLQTIHGPAGLDIGAETPEQIALAILAEIQALMAGREGGKLRQRQAPIFADASPHQERSCVLPL